MDHHRLLKPERAAISSIQPRETEVYRKHGALGGVHHGEAVEQQTVGARTKWVWNGSGWLVCVEQHALSEF